MDPSIRPSTQTLPCGRPARCLSESKPGGWAAIFFAPTLVGTVYGMNFDHMPELHWVIGYPFALLAMVLLSVGLYLLFKRRKWL